MEHLKKLAIRGGFARICAQVAFFALRIVALMVLARLLSPHDFGLVGMVTALTGVLNLFRDFGLSTASIQRATVTNDQLSTLFWLNISAGLILGLLLSVSAPFISGFYHEPRLFWVTIILATSFFFNAAGVQHSALLQRQMRFTALAVIQIVALVLSTALGIGMAARGYGYWSLVVMSITLPLFSTICFWRATSWIPSMPRRQAGAGPLIRFGGLVTLNSLIIYLAYNLDKILLGRFMGASVVGLYGRSYQIINIPTENLNTAVGEVAFAALSRVQGEPNRLRNYFLKGYSLVLTLTVPITFLIALFSRELVLVILGPQWNDAAMILRLLAPTILVFGLINPVGWLLFSAGMIGRCVRIALVITPTLALAYFFALPFGPQGVALAFSSTMVVLTIPLLAWGVRGTPISFLNIVGVLRRPLIAGAVGAVLDGALKAGAPSLPPYATLILGGIILVGAYMAVLLYSRTQREFYFDLFRGLISRPSIESTT